MAKMLLRIGKISFWTLGAVAIVALGFYGARFLTFAQAQGDPDIEQEIAELTESAQAYQANGQYAEAEQIYRDIIQQYPDSDYALDAQKNLVLLFITSGDTWVQQEIDTLIDNYTGQPGLAAAVSDIGDFYWSLKKYEDAKVLYQYLSEHSSDSTLAYQGLA